LGKRNFGGTGIDGLYAGLRLCVESSRCWSFLPIVVANKSLDDHAHQTIPAYFMQHARLMSRLV
jgi:hypothetical protein